MRTRSFALPDKAKMLGCDRQMIQKEMCSAHIPLCDGKPGGKWDKIANVMLFTVGIWITETSE